MRRSTNTWQIAAVCALVAWPSMDFTAVSASEPESIDVAQPLHDAIAPLPLSAETTGESARIKEVIHERYPNRTVKTSREVTQDQHGNYVNHGSWKQWDPDGNIAAEGQFSHGKREGAWIRWYRTTDVELLKTAPYTQFDVPFVSQAVFAAGELDGAWTIVDGQKRIVSTWEFEDGVRHGTSTDFFPNGKKMRVTLFDHGVIKSQKYWNTNGQVVVDQQFNHGRPHRVRIVRYETNRQKKTEAGYLGGRILPQSGDDWWNGRPARFAATPGEDQKHGTWTQWYPNGQLAQEGQFEYDIPVGTFVWWYSNGQKALSGEYDKGLPAGRWTWWHDNGQKKTDGQYVAGKPSGPWSWWEASGKIVRRVDLSESVANVAARPKTVSSVPSQRPAPATPAPLSP